MHKVQELRY